MSVAHGGPDIHCQSVALPGRGASALTTSELDRWNDVTRKMRVCFEGDGVIEQFEGYDRLEELDWLDYQERYGDIQRLDRILEAEGDSTNRYKVSKQADVLMILYLLGYRGPRDSPRARLPVRSGRRHARQRE